LTDSIPEELIALSGTDYSDFVVALELLKTNVDLLRDRQGQVATLSLRGESAISVIRKMLQKCPDQIPDSGTIGLTFIPDTNLAGSIRQDISDAASALHRGEYKAATVLAGAAIEALLLWALQGRGIATSVTTTDRRPIDAWGLETLTSEALNNRLITEHTKNQVDLARNFRNLIHPGRSQRFSLVCDRATALSALAGAEHVVRDLSNAAAAHRTDS
jgi:hypothetical protein